jgi:hypothetical protein
MKFIIVSIFLLTLNFNSFSQVPSSRFESKLDSLNKSLKSIEIRLDSLESRNDSLKVNYDLVNFAIESANSTIEWTGILGISVGVIGIIVTIIVLIIAGMSNSDAKKAIAGIQTAEKRFDEFINSPEKISEALEKMNRDSVITFILSEDANISMEGITRANLLSKDMRGEVAKRINNKIFDPDLKGDIFIQIYIFLRNNSEAPQRFSLKVFNSIDKELQRVYFFNFLRDVFEKKEYPVSLIDFLQTQDRKTDVLKFLLNVVDEKDYIEVIRYSIMHFHDIDYRALCGVANAEKLTLFVESYLNEIPSNLFEIGLDYFNYSQILTKKTFELKSDLENLPYYILKNLDNKEKIEYFVSLNNLEIEENWKKILIIEHMYVPIKIDYLNIMKGIYESKKQELPKNDFFDRILPLLFNVKFGIKVQDANVYFDDVQLTIFDTAPRFGGQFIQCVKHPILDIDIEIN